MKCNTKTDKNKVLHRYQRTQHFKTTNPKGIDKSIISVSFGKFKIIFGGKQMEKQLKDEINKALENIEDIWILHQIYRFAVNMSKDDLSK